jgi:hypothetical protein
MAGAWEPKGRVVGLVGLVGVIGIKTHLLWYLSENGLIRYFLFFVVRQAWREAP